MQRNHTKLICDVSELTGLYSDAHSLSAFLQKTVEMVSAHMQCDVCSIYLYYDQDQELVLSATKGLKKEAVGQVKLAYGEGLTGQSLQESRPISVGRASTHPDYRFFPGIGEEAYESFLAVPIMRGTNRIGVIVIQSARPNFFTPEDINVFRAITSQIAATIETAKLLMSLDQEQMQTIQEQVLLPQIIKGQVGAEGIALGFGIIPNETNSLVNVDKQYSKDDFEMAITATEKQLKELQSQIEEALYDVASLIFTAQILMLKDRSFINAIVEQIDQGINPPVAVESIVSNYVHKFEQMPNEYLREKAHDVKDVGRRLLENILGQSAKTMNLSGKIVIAQELLPSDALKLYSQNVAGIILTSGGATSHLSILCRSLNIPMIIAHEKELLYLGSETQVLMDAQAGHIYLNPDDDVIHKVKDKFALYEDAQEKAEHMKDSTQTQDGVGITLLANINLLGDVKVAQDFKAEGVGLYRTEFPFMLRSDFPTEEEQIVIYRKLIEDMKDKEINFRTLDIGGDKLVSYYDFYGKEENPFLGLRSIRFSLQHKDIFKQQLRAILRAGEGQEIRIMFPMISSLDELIEAKDVLFESQRELKKEQTPHASHPKIGMMIELPAVLEVLPELCEEIDFFSIGTNDLVQYMLAVDRTNEKVANLYLPHHPAVLRALKRIVRIVDGYGKDIAVCGDMAHDANYIAFLIGIGVRKLSLDARYLPHIQQSISKLTLQECEELAQSMLQAHSIEKVNQILNIT